ncbi:MAG: hypothetical protein LBP28_02405 [Coriobacteriales bacterium]|nr:hypothetical protein [Coriobacteriales bacterium]
MNLRAYREKYRPARAYKLSLLSYRESGAVVNMPLYLAGQVVQSAQDKEKRKNRLHRRESHGDGVNSGAA